MSTSPTMHSLSWELYHYVLEGVGHETVFSLYLTSYFSHQPGAFNNPLVALVFCLRSFMPIRAAESSPVRVGFANSHWAVLMLVVAQHTAQDPTRAGLCSNTGSTWSHPLADNIAWSDIIVNELELQSPNMSSLSGNVTQYPWHSIRLSGTSDPSACSWTVGWWWACAKHFDSDSTSYFFLVVLMCKWGAGFAFFLFLALVLLKFYMKFVLGTCSYWYSICRLATGLTLGSYWNTFSLCLPHPPLSFNSMVCSILHCRFCNFLLTTV